MKKIILIIFICVTVIIPALSAKRRHNRNNDEMSWGFTDDSNDNRKRVPNDQDLRNTEQPTTRRMETDDDIRASIDACQPDNTPMPDYTKPGRRVSQVKCLEVIWNIKRRYDAYARERNCFWTFMARKGFYGGDEVGGRAANDGEFPHMGAVGWKAAVGTWIFKCGATLVSEKFAMTAGHCTRTSDRDKTVSDPVPKIVRLGDNNILDAGVGRRDPVDAVISRIIKHPGYKSPKVYNDIALLEFVEPVTYSFRVHPACLWGARNISKLGTQATSTGWGAIETAKYTTSPDLQVTVLDLIDHDHCNSLLSSRCNRKFCGVKNNQICAGKLEGGVDSCQGDSGGPLQVKIQIPSYYQESMYYVIGVTSFGFGCAKANTPAVYTRVSSYVDWIEETVWEKYGVQRE